MQDTLNELTKFANRAGFKFSKTKTQAIGFKKYKTISDEPQLVIENNKIQVVIQVVKEIKILTNLRYEAKLEAAHRKPKKAMLSQGQYPKSTFSQNLGR